MFCFTETHTENIQFDRITAFLPTWDDIHHPSGHGLSICYDTSRVKLVHRFNYDCILQILATLMEIDGEIVFLVLLYRPPGPIGTFVNDLIESIDMLKRNINIDGDYRTLILGDFNWDQMLPEHVASFSPLCNNYSSHQRSNYSTHIRGGILDLVFDDKKETDVDWMFSPFSDHLNLLIEL